MKKFSALVVLATSSATCAACHGAQGEGSATGAPRLAGQNAQYLEHALSMFKAGTCTSSIMQPVASGLSDAEIHELATYFAGLHGTRVPAAAAPPADLVRPERSWRKSVR